MKIQMPDSPQTQQFVYASSRIRNPAPRLIKVVIYCTITAMAMILTTTPALAKDKPRRPGTSLNAHELNRYQYCGRDADCEIVSNGCCDCYAGTAEVAINKEQIDDFRSRFDCNKVSCANRKPLKSCGTKLISCVNHRCLLVDSDKNQDFGKTREMY